MQNGEFWEMTPSMDGAKENGFGFWPGPVKTDFMGAKVNGIRFDRRRFVRTSLTTQTEFGAKLTDAFRLVTGKNLPPSFAEWMMGWTIGWTELAPLEMDKFQQWLHSHGKC
jgi:hypothetical protein